jgi:OOP family OmpA-OmpF porin
MKKYALAMLLSAAISAPAFAANANSAYLALDYGTWSMSNAGVLPNPGVLTLSGGYHFSPNVGAEVGLALVGDSIVNYPGGQTTYSQSALKFAAVGTLPLAPQFDLFGKLGFNSITGKLSDTFLGSSTATTTNVMYGIGGQFNIDNQMGVRVQYENLGKTKASSTATGADVTSLSVGFVLNF